MRRALLTALAAALAAAALLVSGIAAAAVSPVYNLTGLVTAADSTEARFVGTGSGSGGDRLVWRAELQFTSLSTDPAAPALITGGELTATSVARRSSERIEATFTGGTVTFDPVASAPGACGSQVYDVTGDIAHAGGTGSFAVRITTRSLRIFNRCIPLGATMTGTPGLKLGPSEPASEF
jgi:hypothetical protein